jgi:hypothetical protein
MEVLSTGVDYMPSTIDQVNDFVAHARQQILNGEIDYREVLRRKKLLAFALERIFDDKEVKSHLQAEFEKEGQKKINYQGCEISFASRRNFTYDKCNDPELVGLIEQAEPLNIKIKDRQKFLQMLNKPIDIVTEDGEVNKIYPAAFTSTDFFTVSLKEPK